VPTTSWQHYRARIAAKRRHHGPTADVSDDLRAMRAAQAAEYLREVRGGLTVAQRSHLAVVLLTPDGGEAA
jgi:hypothetical protein